MRSQEIRPPSCWVDLKGLKRLYHDLQEHNREAAKFADETIKIQEGQDAAEFERARQEITDLFKASCIILGSQGERIVIQGEDEIDSMILPATVNAIQIDTGFRLQTIGKFNWVPHRAQVLFDFRRTEPTDLSNISGAPSPNTGLIRIDAEQSNWAAGVSKTINDFLGKRRLRSAWLHGKNSYDASLFFLGLPSCLWIAFRIGQGIDASALGQVTIIPQMAKIYVFFAALILFRILFGVARWIFPYMMLKEEGQNPGNGIRTFFGTLIIGALTTVIVDTVRTLF